MKDKKQGADAYSSQIFPFSNRPHFWKWVPHVSCVSYSWVTKAAELNVIHKATDDCKYFTALTSSKRSGYLFL